MHPFYHFLQKTHKLLARSAVMSMGIGFPVDHDTNANIGIPHMSGLLLNVKQVSGIPLPRVQYNQKIISCYCFNALGQQLYEVGILNEYESTLHLVESQVVSLIAMALPKITKWEGLDICLNYNLIKKTI